MVIFFCLQYPNNGGFNLDWWGNTIYQHTLDGQGAEAFVKNSGIQTPFGLTTVRTPFLRSKPLLNLIAVDLIELYIARNPTRPVFFLSMRCYHCFHSYISQFCHLGI